MFLKSGKKLTIHQKYTPVTTFLSPVQKYNQRSFSASSLHPNQQRATFSGSLRDQIRLQSFKKSVLTDSKLNKTAINKANLKIHVQQGLRNEETRQQIRDLNNQLIRLKQQNFKQVNILLRLTSQHSQDIILISRQNQLITQLQKEIMLIKPLPVKQNPCQCYRSNQYMIVIHKLQLRIRHLQEQKKQFKDQIRSLIIKQQQLKYQLTKNDEKLDKQLKYNRKLHDIIYVQDQKPSTKQRQKLKQQVITNINNSKLVKNTTPKIQEIHKSSNTDKGQANVKQSDLKRYYDYLKNIRNRQIDQIQNILNQ